MAKLSTLTIASGANVSSSFEVRYNQLIEKLAIVMPNAWTAANLKLQFSLDDGLNWKDVYDSAGDLLKLTGLKTTGGGVFLAPADTDGKDYWASVINSLSPADFRLASIDTSDNTAENQAAERVIVLYKSNKLK